MKFSAHVCKYGGCNCSRSISYPLKFRQVWAVVESKQHPSCSPPPLPAKTESVGVRSRERSGRVVGTLLPIRFRGNFRSKTSERQCVNAETLSYFLVEHHVISILFFQNSMAWGILQQSGSGVHTVHLWHQQMHLRYIQIQYFIVPTCFVVTPSSGS
jgi:hypothetical protein